MFLSFLQLEEKRDIRTLPAHFFGELHRLVRGHEPVCGAVLQPEAWHARMDPVRRAGEIECRGSFKRKERKIPITESGRSDGLFRFGIAVDRIAVSSRVEDDKVLYFGIQAGKAEPFHSGAEQSPVQGALRQILPRASGYRYPVKAPVHAYADNRPLFSDQ